MMMDASSSLRCCVFVFFCARDVVCFVFFFSLRSDNFGRLISHMPTCVGLYTFQRNSNRERNKFFVCRGISLKKKESLFRRRWRGFSTHSIFKCNLPFTRSRYVNVISNVFQIPARLSPFQKSTRFSFTIIFFCVWGGELVGSIWLECVYRFTIQFVQKVKREFFKRKNKKNGVTNWLLEPPPSPLILTVDSL